MKYQYLEVVFPQKTNGATMQLSGIDRFNKRMLQIYEDAKEQIGYRAYRFLQKVKKDGVVAAAKAWLNSTKATSGLIKLADHDRLDLSVEAVAIQPEWESLFTSLEIAMAKKRLAVYGDFRRRKVGSKSITVTPQETKKYVEGKKIQVTLSAYERNPQARKKCIQHYGVSCYTCGFDFERKYGSIGAGFIHVHHLFPLSEARVETETDPIADLRPVCPNCHAMLHRTVPVVSVGALQRSLRYKRNPKP